MISNRYVVLNCPTLMGNRLCYGKVARQCADCADCVIKQVIEKCKHIIDDDICLECNKFERGLDCFECDYDGHREDIMRGISRVSLAKQILQLFDIEEIK